MSYCPNCKAKLSCGCQLRSASDGTRACTNCLNSYESQLAKKKSASTPVTSPANISVRYTPPPRIDTL